MQGKRHLPQHGPVAVRPTAKDGAHLRGRPVLGQWLEPPQALARKLLTSGLKVCQLATPLSPQELTRSNLWVTFESP